MGRPLSEPRVKDTDAPLISVWVMAVIVGADGTVYGVSETEFESVESPLVFVATRVMEYSVPLVRLDTIMGVVVVPLLTYDVPFNEYL